MDRTILLDENGCFDEEKITRYVLKLQSRIAELELKNKVTSKVLKGHKSDIDHLTKKNKILDDALKYYERGDGWYSSHHNIGSDEAFKARQAAKEVE